MGKITDIKEMLIQLNTGNLELACAISKPLGLDLAGWAARKWKRRILRNLRTERAYVNLVKSLFRYQRNPKSQFAKWVWKMRKCSKVKGGRSFMSAPQDWQWTINNTVVSGEDARRWLEGLLENMRKESRCPITRAQAIEVVRKLAQAYKKWEAAINSPYPRYCPSDIMKTLDPEGYAMSEAKIMAWIEDELSKLQ